MAEIKLDKERIKETIEKGDRFDGRYVLAVAPDDNNHRIHWMENNRQWDPWPDGWLIIGIPALFPEGSGEEHELAEDLLKDNLPSKDEPHDAAYIIEKLYQADTSIVEYVEDHFPNEWEDYKENSLDFLLDAFLAACNGYGDELNDPAPWGYIYDEYGEGPIAERKPPAEFDWA